MSRTAITIKNLQADELVYNTLQLPADVLNIPCSCATGNPFNVDMHSKFHNRTYSRINETLVWQEA